MSRVTRIVVCALMALSLLMGGAALAQPATTPAPTVKVSTVKFKRASATLAIGKEYDFNLLVSVLPKAATDKSLTWKTSNAEIATVDASGVVKILRGGTFRVQAISVSNPNKKATMTVKAPYVKVKTVTLSATSAMMDKGDSAQITATVSPKTATYPKVTWTTSDDKVAKVSENGQITAAGPGVCTVTATCAMDKVKDTLKVRVRGGDMVTIKLSAVGDVTLGGDKRRVKKADDPIGDGQTSYSRFKALYDANGASYFFKKVAGELNSDSVTIANIEGNLTNVTSHQNKSVVLAGPSKYREALAGSGVEIGSIANNHAYDFGEQGHRDTVTNLRSAGLKVVGQGKNNTATTTVEGVKMGFCSFQMPARRDEVQKTIKALKVTGKCKIVVISFHWATSPEWTSNVYASERAMARFAVLSGADLVLGHHKHMVSGIERYKGKMIAYDLGNFVSLIRHKTAAGAYVTKDSMIYQQRFHVFSDGYVEVASPSILPCLNSKSLETFTAQPHVVTGGEAERILGLIRAKTPTASKDLVRTISGY